MKGGKRPGAGRPKGTTKPPTCVLRVPIALREAILSMIETANKKDRQR